MDAEACSSLSVAGPSSSFPPPPKAAESASLKICKFYKAGTCRYGSACRNAHTDSPEASCSEVTESTESVESAGSNFKIDPLKWINAPEFVPTWKKAPAVPEPLEDADDENAEDEAAAESNQEDSLPAGNGSGLSYAEIVTMNNNHNGLGIIEEQTYSVLCPYYENSGVCMIDGCLYEHGELCELCGKFCLNPTDKEQQRLHNAECIKQHELDMEHSFAIQRSKDKVCGICLEVILEKPGREQRFGILPNCNHIFCLECIRTWRKTKNFENKIKRGCPTCRVSSDYVCPSIVWVDGRDEKSKLINDYKKACNTTNCKHFKQGSGKCPFGNRCFYKHALPTGQLVDVGGPSRQSENRIRFSHLQDFFLEVLNQRGRLLDDFVSSFFSDSDESELSELYDYYDM